MAPRNPVLNFCTPNEQDFLDRLSDYLARHHRLTKDVQARLDSIPRIANGPRRQRAIERLQASLDAIDGWDRASCHAVRDLLYVHEVKPR